MTASAGDKTQIATVALAARYESTIAMVAGITFGMMLANVPAVLLRTLLGAGAFRLLTASPLALGHPHRR